MSDRDLLADAIKRSGRDAGRFFSKVSIAPSGCWEWTAARDRKGYGMFSEKRRPCIAHRWLYQALHGQLKPEQQLDHLCRNRACVNPAHLDVVTCRENLLRGETITARNHAKTHCANGHEYTTGNTIKRQNGTRRCRTCARAQWRDYEYKRCRPRSDRGRGITPISD